MCAERCKHGSEASSWKPTVEIRQGAGFLAYVSVLAALESSDDIESEVSARDLAEYIDRLIDLMPTRQRQVFNMSRREHKSYREIAEELNLSQKTVEAHMHEALRFLRDNLALLLWLALFNDGPVC